MSGAASFQNVADLLRQARDERVSPAAVIEVGTSRGPLWQHAAGAPTYGAQATPCAHDTVFDLASLTKVIATTTLAMRVEEAEPGWCDTRVAALEPSWSSGDRQSVTVRHLLEHASGLPTHVRLYATTQGRAGFLKAIAETPLACPPATASHYSDLGFILLGFLIESSLGATLDRLFADIAASWAAPIQYLPPAAWLMRTAPTEHDPWRGRILQGEVHDENAAALGGVAGHAGLFGTAAAVGKFATEILQTDLADSRLARRDTLRMFTTRSRVPGSSRALGWDTMLPTSSCGTRMSARAIGHTGFTGTSLWIDPERDVYVVLLTNRVHPSRDGEGIQPLRRAVHDAVMVALGW